MDVFGLITCAWSGNDPRAKPLHWLSLGRARRVLRARRDGWVWAGRGRRCGCEERGQRVRVNAHE